MPVTDESAERDPVEALAEEYLARRRSGERPTLDEYASKFPDLADRIRSFFPAVQLLDEFTPPAPPPKIPERLGEFRIVREVGRGGMGVVYEAEQTSLGRRVALKVLPPHAARDDAYLSRFRRESRTAAKLHHTNIVPVHGVGEQDGVHFLAMQLIRGAGLDVALADLRRSAAQRETPGGPATTPIGPPWRRAAGERQDRAGVARSEKDVVEPSTSFGDSGRATQAPRVVAEDLAALARSNPPAYYRSIAALIAQAADALAYAHAQGVVHRDVKPGNLLLDGAGTLWVSDFGLAKAVGSDELTQPGFVVGTPRYLAPERLEGKDGPASDVFALGATLYELLTRAPAFEGADRAALAYRICRTEPARPRSLAPDLPRDLETVCLKCLEKDPNKRYAAADLATDLRRFLEGRPVRARRVGPVERLARWAQRNPVVAGLTAGLFVVLAAGLGTSFTLWRQSEAHRQDAENQAEAAITASRDAETQRDLATERLGDAMKAVDTFLTKVSETTLLDRPGLQPLRKELLEAAVDYYSKFLARRAGDPALAVEVADAHIRLGKLRAVLGERDAAAEQYRKARDLLRDPGTDPRRRSVLADAHNALAVDHQNRGEEAAAIVDQDAASALLTDLCRERPDDYELHDRLARLEINRGNLHNAHRRMADAVAQYEKARAILTPWRDRRPNDPQVLDSLAVVFNNLGTGEKALRNPDVALERYAESRQLREQLEQLRPGRLDDSRAIAMLDRNVGTMHLSRRKVKEAKAAYDQARERMDRLVKDNPHVPGLKVEQSRTAMQQCLALEGMQDVPAALGKAVEAAGILEPLATDPTDVPVRALLAETIAYHGHLHERLKAWDLALADYDRAIAMWEQLLTNEPPAPPHMEEIVSCLASRGVILRQLKRAADSLDCYDQAERWQRRLIAVAPTDRSHPFGLGKVFAGRAVSLRHLERPAEALAALTEAIPLLTGGGVPATAANVGAIMGAAKEAAQLADGPMGEAAELAVRALQAASRAGWKNWAAVRTDKAYARIRERPEVRALIGGAK